MSNLKLLAQSLGLSITTVSRALDGYSDVAPATRERVQAAAIEEIPVPREVVPAPVGALEERKVQRFCVVRNHQDFAAGPTR